MRFPRTVRRLRDGESGVTLVETLMVVALLSTVIAASMGALLSSQRTAKGADLRLENLAEAQLIMNVVSRDLRTAVRPAAGQSPFLLAENQRVRFYGNLGTSEPPKLLELRVDGLQVIETATPPSADGTYNPADARTRVVGRNFANPPAQPLLTYLDAAGAALPAPLSADARLLVDRVRIDLFIRKSTDLNVAPTAVRTTVRLPNVEYGPTQEA